MVYYLTNWYEVLNVKRYILNKKAVFIKVMIV